ncbi:MAG TPA: GspE/PulE family protein [Candidatus Paceibacterota bacterium]|nr:GspE/PulE family protein [Candidatus Pacearchaeota archaeon]HRZ51460.1 GspE/PulE family protein [Candidatus Paceibacterota bacterium]HSA37198.1 GspE/PulE family protein [Candidatus Paceibacterota bacterium]
MLRHILEQELAKGEAAVSVVKLVSLLVQEAQELKASDIHIDPQRELLCVRYRIDGWLCRAHDLPKQLHGEIISRIKILSGLRTDEHQAAQDGRFRANLDGRRPYDVRVSVAPTYYGENAVLRLLSDTAGEFTLAGLGFSQENQKKIENAVKKPYGMILATGPTGSGKTSTLYALLKSLNRPEVSIVTIEDPIEYSIDGIEQIQVNSRTSLTFANGLRSILRQDPNIIMVGEIRDPETAHIAVNAALTGHLVFSSLHTNDASTTLPRLLDMGVESYLMASTVNAAIGQRLVRKICSNCKEVKKITELELKSLSGIVDERLLGGQNEFYFGKGCDKCANLGYRGRIGINEVLVPDAQIRAAVLKRSSAGEIKKIAVKQGMATMVEDGFIKAQQGITTIEEVLRIIHE